jgi:ankyrin repeat protein
MKKLLLISALLIATNLSAQERYDSQHDFSITKLMCAAMDNDMITAERLIALGINVNEQDRRGLSPLMYAALNNHPDMISFLLDNGADINMTDKMAGSTALIWAASANNLGAAQKLIERGADRNIMDQHNMTAFDYARTEEMKRLLAVGPRI